MKDRYEEHTKKACSSCIHKSRIKLESSATWCLKLMLHIEHPQFACMFYEKLEKKTRLAEI
jgi:hypothetical protein